MSPPNAGAAVLTPLVSLALPSTCVGCRRARGPICPTCRTTIDTVGSGGAARVWPDPVPAGLPPTWATTRLAGTVRLALTAYKDHGRRDLTGDLAGLLLRPSRGPGSRIDSCCHPWFGTGGPAWRPGTHARGCTQCPARSEWSGRWSLRCRPVRLDHATAHQSGGRLAVVPSAVSSWPTTTVLADIDDRLHPVRGGSRARCRGTSTACSLCGCHHADTVVTKVLWAPTKPTSVSAWKSSSGRWPATDRPGSPSNAQQPQRSSRPGGSTWTS
jgi:hypothetical protein